MKIKLTAEERLEVFGPFDPDKYAAEAKKQWGDTDAYRESARRSAEYSKDDWLRIKAEGELATQRLAAAMTAGLPAGSAEAMDAAEAHRRQIDRLLRVLVRDARGTGGDLSRRPEVQRDLRSDRPGACSVCPQRYRRQCSPPQGLRSRSRQPGSSGWLPDDAAIVPVHQHVPACRHDESATEPESLRRESHSCASAEPQPAQSEAPDKETAMRQSLLFYNGTTYRLSADVARDLLKKRGVIVVDPSSDIYALSPEHEIEEVEPFATVLGRTKARGCLGSGGCGSVGSACSEGSSKGDSQRQRTA